MLRLDRSTFPYQSFRNRNRRPNKFELLTVAIKRGSFARPSNKESPVIPTMGFCFAARLHVSNITAIKFTEAS